MVVTPLVSIPVQFSVLRRTARERGEVLASADARALFLTAARFQ